MSIADLLSCVAHYYNNNSQKIPYIIIRSQGTA